MAIYLKKLENLRPVRSGNFRDWEKFANIPDITIINLKENGNCVEKRRRPYVETLRKWKIIESEYQMVAHETVCEFQDTNRQSRWRT